MPDGLAYWEALGGWDSVARLSDLVAEGQRRVAGALVVLIEGLPVMPAPTMRLVPLPDGMLGGRDQANAFYEEVSAQRVEVAAGSFDGAGYLLSRRRRTALRTTTTGWPARS